MPAALDFSECRRRARRRLPRGLFQYIDRGTEAELALATIREHLDAVRLVPETLAGPAERDVSTRLMGVDLTAPVIVAPTALAGLVAHDGEAKLARAAADLDIPFCVSTQSITPIEDIRAAAPDAALWFQLYMFRNRDLTWRLLDRVREAGVDTLVVTSDTPAVPIRRYNEANGFGVPVRASLPLALDLATHPRWTLSVMLRYVLSGGIPTYGHYPPEFRSSLTRDTVAEDVRLDQNLGWDDIDELRRRWPGKIVLKGILSKAEAIKARDREIEAIVVSAHGGRNLDMAPTPAEVLPEIVEAVAGKIGIIADSGIRSGGDVARYLALGADAVMVGRLPLYGLAAAGEAGARECLEVLLTDLKTTMAFLGVRDLAGLRRARRCASR